VERALHVLLQLALVVAVALVRHDLARAAQQVVLDEAPRGLEALVEVDGAQHRLEGVAEDGGPPAPARFHLGVAQEEEAAEADLVRPPGQDGLRDQERLGLRELALVLVGMTPVQVLARDQAEHGVPEELQPLVGLARSHPGHAQVGAVGERQPQQLGVVEVDAEVL
jgi:hypothetical protein